MSLNRFAKRRDPNEGVIVAALVGAGCMVWRLDRPVDLLVGFRGRWILLEVKSPPGERGGTSRRGQKLNPAQARFFGEAVLHELPLHTVTTAPEALAAVGAAMF